MLGVAYAILCAIFLSASQIVSKKGLERTDVYTGTFLTVLISSIFLLLTSTMFADIGAVQTASPIILGYIAAVGLIHFSLGRTLLCVSIKKIGVSRTSPIVGTTPLFAAILAIIFLNESINPPLLIGILSTIIGVYLITTS